mmetsp:Transcript_155735/g.478121  ORF Transcript_155735/g.478121 Transcript_155735/m.478121 type:complete len:240 (+) Transcript_155735:118-837(+)
MEVICQARRRPQGLPRGCWTPPGLGPRGHAEVGCSSSFLAATDAPMARRRQNPHADVSLSTVSGFDEGVSVDSSDFGFFCQALRPHSSSGQKVSSPSGGPLPSRLAARSNSLSDLPALPPFPSRRGQLEDPWEPWAPAEAAAKGGRRGAGGGSSGKTPLRVVTLLGRKEAALAGGGEACAPKARASPLLLGKRDGRGGPLSHGGFPDDSPEEGAIGPLTPLQGGVSKPAMVGRPNPSGR